VWEQEVKSSPRAYLNSCGLYLMASVKHFTAISYCPEAARRFPIPGRKSEVSAFTSLFFVNVSVTLTWNITHQRALGFFWPTLLKWGSWSPVKVRVSLKYAEHYGKPRHHVAYCQISCQDGFRAQSVIIGPHNKKGTFTNPTRTGTR